MTDPRTDPAADPKRVADADSTVTRADPVGSGTEQQDTLDAAQGGGDAPRLEALNRADAAQTQFPSLHGQVGVEVAERSADVVKASTRRHRKVFRIFHGGLDFIEDAFDHGPNKIATRQYMVDHGLRPVGDVSLVESKPFDENNTDLTYEVEAIPAQVATDPGQVNTVVAND